MPPTLSIRVRTALAVGLLVGFYAIALAVALGLAWIPYAEWLYAHRVDGRVGVFCVIGAFAILKGIFPRRDKFVAPGPPLTEADQPKLFAEIRDVAARTNQAMPADVYLLPDVNAWVAERGGTMGMGGRRVMGIGLPLLEALTVPQFRAVIAHEFGHYHHGDTKLGPWIYRTRAAIMRTLESVARHSSWLSKPFEWYGIAFIRITHAISRRQEYVADAVAARVAGATHVAGALRSLERAGMGFGAFWQQELSPALARGYRPPVARGFAMFLSAPRVVSQLDELLERELRDGTAGPYDTHPSLRERLAALGDTSAEVGMADRARAVSLLNDLPAVEAALIASLASPNAAAFEPIDWSSVPFTVLPVGWVEIAKPSLPGLEGLTPLVLPDVAARLAVEADALVRQLGVAHTPRDNIDAVRAHATSVLEASVALALIERVGSSDVRVDAPPGEPVVFSIATDSAQIVPFGTIAALRDGKLDAAGWRLLCEQAGIADVDLAACVRRSEERLRPAVTP